MSLGIPAYAPHPIFVLGQALLRSSFDDDAGAGATSNIMNWMRDSMSGVRAHNEEEVCRKKTHTHTVETVPTQCLCKRVFPPLPGAVSAMAVCATLHFIPTLHLIQTLMQEEPERRRSTGSHLSPMQVESPGGDKRGSSPWDKAAHEDVRDKAAPLPRRRMSQKAAPVLYIPCIINLLLAAT